MTTALGRRGPERLGGGGGGVSSKGARDMIQLNRFQVAASSWVFSVARGVLGRFHWGFGLHSFGAS